MAVYAQLGDSFEIFLKDLWILKKDCLRFLDYCAFKPTEAHWVQHSPYNNCCPSSLHSIQNHYFHTFIAMADLCQANSDLKKTHPHFDFWWVNNFDIMRNKVPAFCWMSSSLSPRRNTLSTLSLRREVTSLTSPSRSSNLSRLLAPLLLFITRKLSTINKAAELSV